MPDFFKALNATLLRKIAMEPVVSRPPDSSDAEQLVREAEDFFRLARMPGLMREMTRDLKATGHQLMARAVKIDTERQRANEKRGQAKLTWNNAISSRAQALLRLSHACDQSEVAEEIKDIAHSLLDLAREDAATPGDGSNRA